jgi:uncharacterized delta-60 repeat protein
MHQIVFGKPSITLPVFFFSLLLSTIGWTQTIDPNFKPEIYARGGVRSAVQQSDGKLILVGDFTNFNGEAANCVVRLNADGSVDTGFDVGKGPSNSGYVTGVYNVALQSDGKVLLTGSFTSFNNVLRKDIVRLNANGSVDGTFVPPTSTEMYPYGGYPIVIASDGKILYHQKVTIAGVDYEKIARLNSNGSLDATFDTKFKGYVNDVQIQADGKILVGGSFTEYNGGAVSNFIRINSDATLDNSFGASANSIVKAILIQPDKKILLAGSFSKFNNVANFNLIRISEAGAVDGTFSGGQNEIEDLELDGSGKILACGYKKLIRINSNGSNDKSFDAGVESNFFFNVVVQSDSKILAVGSKTIARIDTNFTADATFAIGFGAAVQGGIFASVLQSSGKAVLFGNFIAYNGVLKNGIVRLNTDLTLDNTFNTYSGYTGEFSTNLACVQSDDKIIVCFASYVIRLNADGSLDNSYDAGLGAYGINTIAIDANDKTVVGGEFGSFSGQSRKYLLRLNTDGTIDETFNPDIDGEVKLCAIEPGGKILLHGSFSKIGEVTLPTTIARISADGALDGSFVPWQNFGEYVYSLTPLPSGNVIVGGVIELDDVAYACTSLNNNGSRDSFFTNATSTALPVFYGKMFLLNDGSLLLGANKMVRLTQSGKDGVSFTNIAMNSDSFVKSVLPLSKSDYLVYGYFDYLASTTVTGLAHVTYTSLPDPPAAPTDLAFTTNTSGQPVLSWADHANNETGFIIQRTRKGEAAFENKLQVLPNIKTAKDDDVESNATYTYRVAAYNNGGTSAFTNQIVFESGVITGIEKLNTLANIFPNPGKGIFNIGLSKTNRLVKIVNAQGNVVRHFYMNANESTIDLSREANGFYGVQIFESGLIKTYKVLKQE